MRAFSERLWLPPLLIGAAAWLAFRHAALGDYPVDAAPAVEALAHGHLAAYLQAKPIMGPLATAFEAPFTLLGRDESGRYEWACFGCFLAPATLGWHLAEVARRRGAGRPAQALIGLLSVANPITLEAIRMGHPEELLTVALAVGAVALAVERRSLAAAVCLGLAIASKQWAVLATFPVLMALPERRIRAGVIAAGVAVACFAPALVAAPGAFMDIQGHAASGGRLSTIWSAWYPLSPLTPRALPNLGTVTFVHEQPALIQPLTHPLVVASMVLVPVGLWARRGRFGLGAADAFALLALLALLRCALDPVDNLYYHLPLLLALIGWDAVDSDGLPLRGLAATAVAMAFFRWSNDLGDLALFNAAYLATVVALAVALTTTLFKKRRAGYWVLRPAAIATRSSPVAKR